METKFVSQTPAKDPLSNFPTVCLQQIIHRTLCRFQPPYLCNSFWVSDLPRFTAPLSFHQLAIVVLFPPAALYIYLIGAFVLTSLPTPQRQAARLRVFSLRIFFKARLPTPFSGDETKQGLPFFLFNDLFLFHAGTPVFWCAETIRFLFPKGNVRE